MIVGEVVGGWMDWVEENAPRATGISTVLITVPTLFIGLFVCTVLCTPIALIGWTIRRIRSRRAISQAKK